VKNDKCEMPKTVYVLGAGFSHDANMPLQSHILDRVKDYYVGILSGKDNDEFLKISDTFVPDRKQLEGFLEAVFSSSKTPSLEDVFTLLDQTIINKAYCHSYSWHQLDNIRDTLRRSILLIFHDALENFKKTENDFYKCLAAYWIKARIAAGRRGDPYSIISLDWDALVEDSVYWCIDNAKCRKKVDIDFCCYSSPLDNSSPHTPSILQKAMGLYNIKLLKLHGSTNWLFCPNCNRMFTGVGSKQNAWSMYAIERSCIHCSNKDSKNKTPKLEPFFITPTYLKVFDNAHIQMIWHNAHTELAEADKIVFVGYSLPEADYHLRTLMKRAIRPGTPIDVVLTQNDKPTKRTPRNLRRYYATTRFEDFFSSNSIKFYLGGVEPYFRRIIGRLDIRSKLRQINRKLTK